MSEPGRAVIPPRYSSLPMWIRNSSRYPDEEVVECVEFAVRGIDMRRVCVNVKNGGLGGAAYNGVPEISNAPRSARYLVTLRLGRGGERWPLGPVNYHFQAPGQTGPRNRFPFFVCHDWREWLVKLAAHEAKHIEQFRNRDVCSELSCEHFALERLDEFRELCADEPEPLEPFEPEPLAGSPAEQPAQLVLPGM